MKIFLILLLFMSIVVAAEVVPNESKPSSWTSMWSTLREKFNKKPANEASMETPQQENTTESTIIQEIKTEEVQEEPVPNQLNIIDKALIYTRPKESEVWILNEEGYMK